MSTNTFVVDKENLEIRTTRVFKASAERLFEAFTDKDQIPQWWGPAYLTTTVDKMDVREGGLWRFVQKDKDGNEFAFNGIYKEIVEPTKLVQTFNFEGIPGEHTVLETMTLEEKDGQTLLSTIAKYANIDDLEGMVASGMEEGERESKERLAKLVE